MMFRSKKNKAAPSEDAVSEWDMPIQEPATPAPGGNRWSTALLMIGSALVGATALALWNRRTIDGMRAQIQAQSDRPVPRTPQEEIF